jgi:hypothetical protein
MRRFRILAGTLFLGFLAAPASAQPPVLIGFVEGDARLAVRRAIEGAMARLDRADCQEVLSDFTDESGQNLAKRLLASGMSPAKALAALRFVDDRESPQCQGDNVMAFTQPGSHVIRVCGRQFRDRDLAAAEIIIIHEFLHALGLGENPPTSKEITERVTARCGHRVK